MARYVATHIEIGGKKIPFPDTVDTDDATAAYIADWNGKKFLIPVKGDGFYYSPEIGRAITDPVEIRIAEYATMPLDSWQQCIRITQIPIFTSKQWRLIRWSCLSL